MLNFIKTIPLSLYIHIPWCVRKCPYCDFNSHAVKDNLPETLYVNALLQELDQHLACIEGRPLVSIFFGGGTPSLFSASAIERILNGVAQRIAFNPHIEITLEANPGTIDQARFRDFYQAGINRLSLGIQSLQDDKLQQLGRIHDSANAMRAISMVRESGFTNFNLDIMYGLPNQSIVDALNDIELALTFAPTHFSWYQLTIEPNTLFYHRTPLLPEDDVLWEMQIEGQRLINAAGLLQYEVSAYSLPNNMCLHNRNYWEFGDYLGIGAGAHSKITDKETGKVWRFSQVKHPQDYLNSSKRQAQTKSVCTEDDLIFEFMLNALRLTQGVPISLFTERTQLALPTLEAKLTLAKQRGLLVEDAKHLCPTDKGRKFLNDLVAIFLS